MKTPLLRGQTNNLRIRVSKLFTLFSCTLGSLLLLLVCLFGKSESFQESVGVSDFSWAGLIDVYFAIGSLASLMRHGKEFRGQADPRIAPESCKCAPKCEEVCTSRLDPGTPFHYSVSQDCPPMLSGDGEPTACLHRTNKMTFECWNPAAMRCWNSEGVPVFDGHNENMLIKHVRPAQGPHGVVSLAPWIHLRSESKKVDFIVFGWGRPCLIDDICAQFNDLMTPSLADIISTIPDTQGIIFGGHSEGAGWAICANLEMATQGFRHERRVLVSGSLMGSTELVAQYDSTYPPSHRVALLAATQMPPGFMYGQVVADTLPILAVPMGATYPQFSFTCRTLFEEDTEEVICVNPQPAIDLAEQFAQPEDEQYFIRSMVLPGIHSYDKYRECFLKCRAYFQQHGETFAPNVASFVRQPAPAAPVQAGSVSPIDWSETLPLHPTVSSGAPTADPVPRKKRKQQHAGSSSAGAASAEASSHETDEAQYKKKRPPPLNI